MKWPAGFEPGQSSVFAHNQIAIAAPPDRVWRWLIRAARWPDWYTNSSNVTFLSAGPPDLAPGIRFRWKTFGATITSRVLVFEPPRELGWDEPLAQLEALYAELLTRAEWAAHRQERANREEFTTGVRQE